jgi:hypothetical protein
MTSRFTAVPGGCGGDTSLFQLVSDISEEYGKNCISFQSFSLQTLLKVLKSSDHGKKHRTGEAGRNRKGAVPAYQSRSSIKEINDDCSI